MKACIKCGVFKPLPDFYAHHRRPDGHVGKCKLCMAEDARLHRDTVASNCSVDGCDKKSAKRAMCDKHYRRFMKHGDPLVTKKRPNGEGFLALGYLAKQTNGVKKFDHVEVAERALGKPLPPGAVVHHVNEIKTDNRPENLVICPDRAYHNLIHARLDAFNACGNADWVKCKYCKQYDDPRLLSQLKGGRRVFWHKSCANDYNRQRKPL